jgi:hypothetical protein
MTQLPIPVRPIYPPDAPASRSLTRAITAHALREMRGTENGSAEQIVAEVWPRDMVAKAASNPITTGGASALQAQAVAAFVSGLQPQSAAARLMAAGIRVDLDGLGTVSIPRSTSLAVVPVFVDEGAPIPVAQQAISAATLGPVKKLALVEVLTSELDGASAESAELIIRTIMSEAAAKALDAAVFSTAAASSSRPAGILNGVTPLTATAGGGAAALLGDIGLLIAALTTAGGGTRVMIFAPPAKAAIIPIYAPGFAIEVVPTPALAPATVIALDPSAVASGLGPSVALDVSASTVLHFEDTTPLQITSGAQGSAVVATPARSMFQTNSLALRLILRCAWCVRAPGLVQFVSSVTW